MTLTGKFLVLGCSAALLSLTMAQPPRERPPQDDKREEGRPSILERFMSFDKNKDGKLTKEEVTDERLQRLFDEADANKDGKVTKEELTALVKKLEERQGDGRGPGGPGGRGPGGPDGRGPGGPGGPGGRGPGGPPQPGQLLSPGLVDRLQLSDRQKKDLEALQKEVNGKLDKLLTEEQRKQLKEMRERGPGGPGGRGPGEGRPGEGRPGEGGRPRPDGERPRPEGERRPQE